MEDGDEKNKEKFEFSSAPGRSQRRAQSLHGSVGGSRPERRGGRRSSSMMTPPFLRLSQQEGESPERSRGRSKENRRSQSRDEPKSLCPSEKSAQHEVLQDCERHTQSRTESPELGSDCVKNSPDCSLRLCLLHSPGPGRSCVLCGADPNSSNRNRKKNRTTPVHKENIKNRRRALRF